MTGDMMYFSVWATDVMNGTNLNAMAFGKYAPARVAN
jgi:hypothetical protein